MWILLRFGTPLDDKTATKEEGAPAKLLRGCIIFLQRLFHIEESLLDVTL